jgi:hypothetical protein
MPKKGSEGTTNNVINYFESKASEQKKKPAQCRTARQQCEETAGGGEWGVRI